jgi:hypothetical protein
MAQAKNFSLAAEQFAQFLPSSLVHKYASLGKNLSISDIEEVVKIVDQCMLRSDNFAASLKSRLGVLNRTTKDKAEATNFKNQGNRHLKSAYR